MSRKARLHVLDSLRDTLIVILLTLAQRMSLQRVPCMAAVPVSVPATRARTTHPGPQPVPFPSRHGSQRRLHGPARVHACMRRAPVHQLHLRRRAGRAGVAVHGAMFLVMGVGRGADSLDSHARAFTRHSSSRSHAHTLSHTHPPTNPHAPHLRCPTPLGAAHWGPDACPRKSQSHLSP